MPILATKGFLMTIQERKIIKRAELARQLQVHEDTVMRWAQNPQNNLKTLKVGKFIYCDITNFDPAKIVVGKGAANGQ